MTDGFKQEDRFDRSIRLFTEEGQRELKETSICIAGVGGLGSMLAVELARLGIGDLTLVDPDHVEESNLPRLLGATEDDVGEDKVEVIGRRVQESNPEARVSTVSGRIEDEEEVLEDKDMVVGCLDEMKPRVVLNDYAIQNLKTYLDAGVRIDVEDEKVVGVEGFMQLIDPGSTACFECLDRIDQEALRREEMSESEIMQQVNRGYIDAEELDPQPAVIHLNGVVGSLTASTVAKVVTGYAEPPEFLRYDGLENELTEVGTSPMQECFSCSQLPDREEEQDLMNEDN